jgi:hypothetical protein
LELAFNGVEKRAAVCAPSHARAGCSRRSA